MTSQLTIPEARASLSANEFREALRQTLLEHPEVTLKEVAGQLGVTRQCVSQIVGRLDRPTCAHPNRPAPKREQAARMLPELAKRVAQGESAERVAKDLGISLAQAMRLGFRAKQALPPHGSHARATRCNCWRCRRTSGVAIPRGRRADQTKLAEVHDWLAWTDPYDGSQLKQAEIGRLAGVAQGAVSRIARAGVSNGY